jgi:hypothetical protein
MAKEEWGVDGYGSMSGLIRLRSPKEPGDEEDGTSDSSESDVEEHVEVERRLDHDLSRFEMIYPVEHDEAPHGEGDQAEARVARLEEENLTLRERLFLVETEMGELRKRLDELEKRFGRGNGGDVDGSNGVEEILSGGDVDERYGGEEDINGNNGENRDCSDDCNVAKKNMDAENINDDNRGEANGKHETVKEDNQMDLSPIRSAGTGQV